MRVEKVGQGRLAQQYQQALVRFFGVLQPRPEVDYPGAAPTRAAASRGKTALQAAARGLGQFRRTAQRHLIAGIKREEVGYVAVAGILLVVILLPFLQLP